MERTHEEATEAIRAGREGRHSEAALAGEGAHLEVVRIGYITPMDMLAGHQQEIHAERDRKLEEARKQRQIRRQQAA